MKAEEKIRNAAAKLFAEKGYAATATREICEQAGVTKPVLYYYFGSKERLYTDLLLGTWKECQEELRTAARRGKTARSKLIDVLAADFAHMQREPRRAAMLFRMIFAPQKEAPSVDIVQIGVDWVGLIAGIVREGIQRGEMRGRPREVGEAILGAQLIYTLSYLLRGQPKPGRRLARRIVDLVVEGCGQNHGKP